MNALAPAALLFGACALFESTAPNFSCTASVEPALIVFVQDSASAAPLAAVATGSVTDGAYSDNLRPSTFSLAGTLLAFRAADERPGTYLIAIDVPGYQPWRRLIGPISRNQCHINTHTVIARLQPAP